MAELATNGRRNQNLLARMSRLQPSHSVTNDTNVSLSAISKFNMHNHMHMAYTASHTFNIFQYTSPIITMCQVMCHPMKCCHNAMPRHIERSGVLEGFEHCMSKGPISGLGRPWKAHGRPKAPGAAKAMGKKNGPFRPFPGPRRWPTAQPSARA